MLISGAVWIFLQSCVLGAVLGMIYDGFRIFRLLPGCSRGLFWQDGCYFLVAASLLFRFALRLCSGQLRLFVLIGCGLGFLLYYTTVGTLVYGFFRWFVLRAERVLSSIGKAFCHLFHRISHKRNVQNLSEPS